MDAVDPSQRDRIGFVLSRGPWLWPEEGSAYDTLRDYCSVFGRPPGAAEPGAVLLVSASAADVRSGALWLLDIGAELPPNQREYLRDQASAAWLRARASFGAGLELIWRSSEKLLEDAPQVVFADATQGRPEKGTGADGDSFGVALAIAQASHVLGVPSPPDIVASAALNPDSPSGRLNGVGWLEAKATVTAERAPRVRKFLIARDQELRDDVVAIQRRLCDLGSQLEFVQVDTLADALRLAFPREALVQQVINEGGTPQQRGRFIEEILRLVLSGGTPFPSWTAIAETVRAIQGTGGVPLKWSGIAARDETTLRCVRGLAETAAGRSDHTLLPEPDHDWLSQWDDDLQLDIATTWVQHRLETAVVDVDSVAAIAEKLLDDTERNRWSVRHARLCCAAARLHAWRRGQLEQAVVLQRDACEFWWRRLRDADRPVDEATRPLAELFLLASVLAGPALGRRREALNSYVYAEARAQSIMASQRGPGTAFVALNRLAAETQLGGCEGPGAAEQLDWLTQHDIPHVRGAALRLQAHRKREQGDWTAAEAALRALSGSVEQAQNQRDTAAVLETQWHLAQLDAALHEDNPGLIDKIVRHLTRVDLLARVAVAHAKADATQRERGTMLANRYPQATGGVPAARSTNPDSPCYPTATS